MKNQITQQIEAGLDEAGRGCLAGPVTAAAVILPPDHGIQGITDSKKISPDRREELRTVIEQHAIAWAISHVLPGEIDRLNILQASITAMHRCVDQLGITPGFLAVDGNRFRPYPNIPHQTVVKGDSRFIHIAAASILAKTHRDTYMAELHEQYPCYGWRQNKGYPTTDHRNAIEHHGPCPWHRKSFRLFRD